VLVLNFCFLRFFCGAGQRVRVATLEIAEAEKILQVKKAQGEIRCYCSICNDL
jgi:hypothetical protein